MPQFVEMFESLRWTLVAMYHIHRRRSLSSFSFPCTYPSSSSS
jgi:hypothetical protein